MTSFISFARKRKENFTFDSVCTRCYEVVASDQTEPVLAEAEQSHACEPVERPDISHLFA